MTTAWEKKGPVPRDFIQPHSLLQQSNSTPVWLQSSWCQLPYEELTRGLRRCGWAQKLEVYAGQDPAADSRAAFTQTWNLQYLEDVWAKKRLNNLMNSFSLMLYPCAKILWWALGFRPMTSGKAKHMYVPEGRKDCLVTQQLSTHFRYWVVSHFPYLIL